MNSIDAQSKANQNSEYEYDDDDDYIHGKDGKYLTYMCAK